MTVADLIKLLEDHQEKHGADAEVLVAMGDVAISILEEDIEVGPEGDFIIGLEEDAFIETELA